MRRSRWLLISAVVVGGLALRSGTCSSKPAAPDERLASDLSAICDIADRHIEAPQPGVKKLMRYLGDHAPEMLQAWGELLVTIERIDSDRAHDDRARLAGRRLAAVMTRCEQPLAEFGEAVEADPEASRTLQRGIERLNRTLEIIFAGGVRSLRAQIDQLLATGTVPRP